MVILIVIVIVIVIIINNNNCEKDFPNYQIISKLINDLFKYSKLKVHRLSHIYHVLVYLYNYIVLFVV